MLLLIKKENVNQIAVTLNEKADFDLNINWLFRFVREQTNKDYFVYLNDVSASPNRFNLFVLYEGNDLDLPEGEYRYEIYQKQVQDFNFGNGILCETGKAKVFSDTTEINQFNNTNTLINVYE
jgi:hypothetical protein